MGNRMACDKSAVLSERPVSLRCTIVILIRTILIQVTICGKWPHLPQRWAIPKKVRQFSCLLE